LCVAGEEGAVQVLEILRRELDEAMLLCGCTKLSDIDGSLLKLLVEQPPLYMTHV
jgi:isopentenyl diphosphate isomerase/L-lactate dehydrogenase-like FMN-dependent dehydrogenase